MWFYIEETIVFGGEYDLDKTVALIESIDELNDYLGLHYAKANSGKRQTIKTILDRF